MWFLVEKARSPELIGWPRQCWRASQEKLRTACLWYSRSRARFWRESAQEIEGYQPHVRIRKRGEHVSVRFVSSSIDQFKTSGSHPKKLHRILIEAGPVLLQPLYRQSWYVSDAARLNSFRGDLIIERFGRAAAKVLVAVEHAGRCVQLASPSCRAIHIQ